jgi:methylated-DNA-[protein]-cysteine S-methyltransferase
MESSSRSFGCAFLDVTPIRARLWIVWSERGLRSLSWGDADSSAAQVLGEDHPAQGDLPEPYASVLRGYLSGADVEPCELPIDPVGTAFQHKVWTALREIPRGRVRSYAAVAGDVGSPRAMRAVGGANGKNPLAIVVPCHRVVEAGMGLGGYSGGLHIKRFLLELEGCAIVADHVQPGQLELI